MAVDLGTAYGKILIDSSGAVSGFRKAGTAGIGFGKAIAGLGIGTVIAKAVGSTISAAARFNQAMADIRAVADVTGAQMARLSAQAIKAGASTRFSATEAAQGQLELAKAGLSVQQILNGGLDTALSLAAAGNMGVAEAATAAANSVQLFGLQGKQLAGVADALATAANRTTADVGDFALALSQGGAAAKQAGLGFQDTVTALEALALQGVKGSDAGTSLKAALLSIAAPIGAGAKAVEKYNLEFFKANGQIKSFAGITQELQTKLGGLNQQQRTAVLQAIAGRDGFRVFAAAMDAGAGKVKLLRRELDQQGKAAKVAAERQNSLSGDVEQLGGAFESLQIKASRGAVPALRSAAQAATRFVNALGDGSGTVGQFTDGLVGGLRGVGSVLGNVVGVALQIGGAVATAVAPLAQLTGEVLASDVAVKVLTASVIGLSAAFLASRAAAAALFAVQKAAAILGAVQAFLQLAATVRTAAEAMQLLRAATMASPIGLFAASVGIAVGAVTLLTGAFRRGPSAAEQQAKAMDRVKASADAAAGALDRARDAADKITDARLQATQAALDVQSAERSYQQALAQSGPKSLEAQQAENQLAQSRLRLTQATRASGKAVTDSSTEIAKEAASLIEQRNAANAAIAVKRQYLGINRALNSSTAEGRAKTAQYEAEIAKLSITSSTASKGLSSVQQSARIAAAALAGNASPAARATRQELLAIANAKPAALPKVVAAVSDGTTKALAKAKSGVASIQGALTAVDTSVSLGSFLSSISGGLGSAYQLAVSAAGRIRAALASANADVRNSPSANDLMRGSLQTMAVITESGLKTVMKVTRRNITGLMTERVKLEQQLARIDRAQELRERRKQGTSARGRIEDRVAAIDKAQGLFGDVESGANDLISRVTGALDAQLARYDARLQEISTRRNIISGGKAIKDADQALTAAQTRLAMIKESIANASSDAERATAQRYLDQAVADVEDARLAAEAARIQVERDKTSLTVEKKKADVEKKISTLVERLRAGEITAKRFNVLMGRILGDPQVRAAINASGAELGLAFARGLARTRSQVRNSALGLAKIVAQYLKLRSPAEKGPLAFDFTRSGAAIGKDFQAGLAGRQAAMRAQAQSFAAAAIPTVRVEQNTAAAGGVGLVQHNTFEVHGPFDARQASHDLMWAAQFQPSGVMT